jgi:hypothetical protein
VNTKRTRISNVKLLYLIALLVATAISTSTMPISRASGTASAGGSSSGASASISYIEHEEDRQALSLDSRRAISLAISSPVFQAKIVDAPYQFNSIYEEFSWSPAAATPSVVMNAVNVVYSHRNTDGTGTNVVAVEVAGLTKVVDVTVQNEMTMRDFHYSGNWDGWEFSTGYGIFEATAHWTVPQAYVPLNSVTGANCNYPYGCDFAPWVGLSENAGGSCAASTDGCIVQGGTDSGQSCGCCGCGPNNGGWYYPWYEFLPANPVACGGADGKNIHYGDSYSEDVQQFPGSTVYRISGNDYTTGYGCSANQNYTYFDNLSNCYYTFQPCANFAQVLAERKNTLPAFTQYTTSQCSINPNYPPSIPCHNIVANEYYMANCGWTNVQHTAPSSSDTWNTWYFGSSGTNGHC